MAKIFIFVINEYIIIHFKNSKKLLILNLIKRKNFFSKEFYFIHNKKIVLISFHTIKI